MGLPESIQFIKVGYAPIDLDHEEFISLLDRLDKAANADFPALFDDLSRHTEQHFERENRLMRQSGFPGQ